MAKCISVIALGVVLSLALGCDAGRISRLEKENEELKAQVKKDHAVGDYDLQEKCSRTAKAWVTENYPSDKDTLMLSFSNHHNSAQNKCFVFVEWHYKLGTRNSWTDHRSLWDVNENV
jgi:hypothetical protein